MRILLFIFLILFGSCTSGKRTTGRSVSELPIVKDYHAYWLERVQDFTLEKGDSLILHLRDLGTSIWFSPGGFKFNLLDTATVCFQFGLLDSSFISESICDTLRPGHYFLDLDEKGLRPGKYFWRKQIGKNIEIEFWTFK